MSGEFFPLRIEYAVEVGKDVMSKILDRDWEEGIVPLFDRLSDIDGVSNVEYGHTQYIYLGIDTDEDDTFTKGLILATIDRYVNGE